MKTIEFHGEVVENHGQHKHYQPKPEDLIGKTIVAFECETVNMWVLKFSDGTAVAIDAEAVGMYNIPTMTFCNTCWTDG
jgi:hypothetical protein